MGELIKKDNDLYNKYEELLLKRDQLYKEACSIETSYVKEFGDLLLKDFELKVECIKKKKMISYCQAAINRGKAIDVQDMNEQIERSMAMYNAQLKQMLASKEDADNSKVSPSYKVERAKRIYRRLAKTIHPDINPEAAANEQIRELWERIVIAYHANDDEELDNLEVLVMKVLKDNGDIVTEPVIDDIEERIEKLEREINDITTTEPYTYISLLSDDKKVTAKKEELNKEIEEYKAYSTELSEVLQKLLLEGGAAITWVEN